jgi:hypothetical protein
MSNIKKKLLVVMILMIMMCSTFMIPAAESKAAECCQYNCVVKATEYNRTETDTHTFGTNHLCVVYIDYYLVHYECNVCKAYLGAELVRLNYRHSNPDCPY